jgi:hypothetical protein
MKRQPILALACLMAVMATAEKCDKDDVRSQMWKWKNKAGKALVEANKTWEGYYEWRSDEIGDKVIADNPGLSDEEYLAKFEEALEPLDKHDDRYQKAKVSTAEGLEALEEALDAWGESTEPNKPTWQKAVNASRSILNGLDDILSILIANDVEVPNILDTTVSGLAKFLNMIAEDPDPDEVTP